MKPHYTAALAIIIALTACNPIDERDYEALEQRCHQLENENRGLRREYNALTTHNKGLADDVDRYSELLENETRDKHDRLAHARHSLATLKRIMQADRQSTLSPRQRKIDSIIAVIDSNLRIVADSRPPRARSIHRQTLEHQ